jgi:hypothetical protein
VTKVIVYTQDYDTQIGVLFLENDKLVAQAKRPLVERDLSRLAKEVGDNIEYHDKDMPFCWNTLVKVRIGDNDYLKAVAQNIASKRVGNIPVYGRVVG